MNPFILSQILIGIASIFDFLSFQSKKKEHTVLLIAISSLFISIHYLLLGALVGGFVVLVSSIRYFTSIFTQNKKLKYLFILFSVVFGFYNLKHIYDVLPIAGTVLGTIAIFQNDPKYMRQIMMIGTTTFITYNILIFSPAAIALESAFLVSNIISYFRFYKN